MKLLTASVCGTGRPVYPVSSGKRYQVILVTMITCFISGLSSDRFDSESEPLEFVS